MPIPFTSMHPGFFRVFDLFLYANKALHEIGNQLGLEFNVSANSEIQIQNLVLQSADILQGTWPPEINHWFTSIKKPVPGKYAWSILSFMRKLESCMQPDWYTLVRSSWMDLFCLSLLVILLLVLSLGYLRDGLQKVMNLILL